jgi:hypothetical protein
LYQEIDDLVRENEALDQSIKLAAKHQGAQVLSWTSVRTGPAVSWASSSLETSFICSQGERQEAHAQRPTLERTKMSQSWIAQALQEHEKAFQRHQRYVAAHETIIWVLRAYEQQAITKAQAIV